jgi:hypothetical protein
LAGKLRIRSLAQAPARCSHTAAMKFDKTLHQRQTNPESCGPHLFDRVVDAHAKLMWHHQSVIALFRIVLQLLTDLMALPALAFRQRRATAAEILVLRRQIALYKERGIKPRRIDQVTRISLALSSVIIRGSKTDSCSPNPPRGPITPFNGASALAEFSATTIAQQPNECHFCCWTLRGVPSIQECRIESSSQ